MLPCPCRPLCPRNLACSKKLVGLLTPKLERLPPSRVRLKNEANPMALWQPVSNAWIQRRGRPGIAPEFPVCLSRATAFHGPPESWAQFSDRLAAVKYRFGNHSNRQAQTGNSLLCKAVPITVKNASHCDGYAGLTPTECACQTPGFFYPMRSVSRAMKNTWGSLKLLSLIGR